MKKRRGLPLKFVDFVEPVNLIPISGPETGLQIFSLNSIGNGTGSYQRVGNRIALHHMSAYIDLNWRNVSGSSNTPSVHHYVVWDRHGISTDGIPPLFADIFAVTDRLGNTYFTLAPFIRAGYEGRYVVLHYECTNFPGVSANQHAPPPSIAQSVHQTVNLEVDLTGLVSQYNAPNPVYASIATGSLLYFCRSSREDGHVFIQGFEGTSFRTYFSDLQ